MLVISQKKGEKIHIGRDITITILESSTGKVRLGIEAPSSIKIVRDSLLRPRHIDLNAEPSIANAYGKSTYAYKQSNKIESEDLTEDHTDTEEKTEQRLLKTLNLKLRLVKTHCFQQWVFYQMC